MNRQCEYDEYKEIMKAGFRHECKNPFFQFKNNFGPFYDETSLNEELNPETFVDSDVRSIAVTIHVDSRLRVEALVSIDN